MFHFSGCALPFNGMSHRLLSTVNKELRPEKLKSRYTFFYLIWSKTLVYYPFPYFYNHHATMYTVQCLVNANKYTHTHTHRGFDSLGKHSTVKLEDCTIKKVLILYRWLHPSPKSSFWNKLFAQKTPFYHQCYLNFQIKS